MPASPPTASAIRRAKRRWWSALASGDRAGEMHREAAVQSRAGQRPDLLGQAAPAEAVARSHVRVPDPGIVPDPLEHRSHVHAQVLGEPGHLVREREAQGQEDVRGVLHQARLLGPHDEERRPGSGERARHQRERVGIRVLAERPDDHPRGPADVLERASLAQELRGDEETLGHHPGPVREARRRPDRQGAPDDARGPCRDGRAACSRARATCDTSVEPVSSIGVPTQTTMRSRPSPGISALGTIRPAACWVAYASGSPGSWNGIRPSASAARRSGSCSTSTMSRPCSARPTAVAIPTYPAPTTAVFNLSRVMKRG